jgi:cytochrome c oxidase cbb3-type subunit 4
MMDMGDARGAITVITMICFLGIFWWAYRSGNRRRFEEDALIPFLDNEGVADKSRAVERSGQVECEGERQP